MLIKTKKHFILWLTIALIFLTVLIITAVVVISYSNNFGKIKNYIALTKQLKDIDEAKLAEYNPPNQQSVNVKHYLLKINLFPKKKIITGDVTITMRLSSDQVRNIDVNFYNNLEITNLEVNGIKPGYKREEKIISIEKPKNLGDSVDIRIVYSGTPESLGFGSFNFGEEGGLPYVYTLSEPIYASTWFPCVDLPDDKALADIYITNDSSDVSVSNGKLISVETVKDKRTYHWKTFYPISTYLIAIYSAPYKSYKEKYISITKDTLNLSFYALPSEFEKAQRDFSEHKEYLRAF